MSKFKIKLPNITTYEEYDQLNLHDELFINAAKEIISYHELPQGSLELLSGTNIVFSHGTERILKIFPPAHKSHYINESLVMKHLRNKLSVRTPAIHYEGEISGWPYIMMNRLDGALLEGLWETLNPENKSVLIRELGALIREVHAQPIVGLESIDCHWEQFIANQVTQCASQHQSKKLPTFLLDQIQDYLESAIKILPKISKPVILTGEYTPMNLLVEQKFGMWHITGLIDFGDSMLGLPQYDLLGPGAFLIQGDKELLKEFLLAYGYNLQMMTPALSKQLTALMLLHRYSNLNVQIRIPNWLQRVQSLSDLEQLVWGF